MSNVNTVPIKVEFFGVPRLRAGVAEFFVQVNEQRMDLGEVFKQLETHFAELANECFAAGQLKKDYIVNITGQEFTRDHRRKLAATDTVLLMSRDAGG